MTDNIDLSTRSHRALAVLALLLYAVLVDAAVETFLSGAPVRMWVASTVAAYLLITVGIWRFGRSPRRFGWSASATASSFVLLGLLAATIRLPEGLTNGVTILGQPTTIVLSAASAVAVAFAGIVLMSTRVLPWWGRAALGALAVYGVVAFVLGIIDATPYPNLVRGGSLWVRLPYGLQGAFIGALIAVPLAMIAAVVDALRDLRAASGRGWRFQQSIALGLATVMAVSGFTMTAGPAFAVTDAPPAGPQISAAEITKRLEGTYRETARVLSGRKEGETRSSQEAAKQLDQLFSALDAVAKEIPRETFDIAAVVQKVGREPVKLFEWVRDETFLVPYRGLLRGPTGVLMDRLGNSLDRAVLLHALLASIGQTVRLGRGTLTEEQAKALLEKARPIPPEGVRALSEGSSDSTEAIVRAFAREQQVAPAALQKAADAVALEQSRVRAAVQNRVTQQTAAIGAAIRNSRQAHPQEDVLRLQAVRDHWWVEWQNGSSWTALDPSLPESAPGMTLTAVTTSVPARHFRDIGADSLQWIRLRVVVETWNLGRLSEAAVLTHDLLPADLIGKSVVLRFVPVTSPGDPKIFQQKDPRASLKQTVLAQREWLPVLQVDGEDFSKDQFNEFGEVGPMTPPESAALPLQGLANSIGGMLGGSTKRTEPAKAPTDKHATAIWIDYEIRGPGQTARPVRRDIVDLLGPAARARKPAPAPGMTEVQRLERGLALMGETEILPLVGHVTPEFLNHMFVTSVLQNREVITTLSRAGATDTATYSEPAGRLRLFPRKLYDLAFARQAWSQFAADTYLAAPNVLTHHKRVRLDESGRLTLLAAIDIVVNQVAVRRGAKASSFDIQMQQGVLDTNAESVLAASDCRVVEAAGMCSYRHNTAEIFSLSHSKTPWLAVHEAADSGWRGADLPPDLRSRVERDLASGHVVMVPPSRVPVEGGKHALGWWRIDPLTGQTLGMGEDGWGQGSVELFLKQNARILTITAATTFTNAILILCLTDADSQNPCDQQRCAFVYLISMLSFGFGSLAGVLISGTGSVLDERWPCFNI